MRSAALALAASALSALACTSAETPPCPGKPVASFLLEGPLVYEGDSRIVGTPSLDPLRTYVDCTPDPLVASSLIDYPSTLPPFDALLAAEADGSPAALCRSNGVVYSGARTGATFYEVEADAEPALLCSSLCAASLRVIVAGDVVLDGAGAPAGFEGVVVEVLTELRGVCEACLPLVPGDPFRRACAARYAVSGTLR